MLSIKLNGKPVVLKEDFSFSMTRENPIFNDPETLAGDYIESMTFPMEGNRKIFQNSNRISSNVKNLDYDISIYFNGYHLVTGTFTIKSAGADYVTGDTKLNALSFFYKIKDLKMTDLPETEVFSLGTEQHIIGNRINEISFGISTYNFPFVFPPMMNEDFYDDSEFFDYEGVINLFDLRYQSMQPNQLNPITQTIERRPFVPCFYLDYLIKTMAKAQQYSIKLPAHTLFEKLIIATNCSIDYMDDEYSVQTKADTMTFFGGGWMEFFHEIKKDESAMYNPDVNRFTVKQSGNYQIKFNLKTCRASITGAEPEDPEEPEEYTDPIRMILYAPGGMPEIKEVNNNDTIYLDVNKSFYFEGNIPFVISIHRTIKGEINIINTENYLKYNGTIKTNKHVPNIEQLKLFTIIKGIFNAGFFVDEMKRKIETVIFNEIMDKKPIPVNIKISEDWSINKEPKGVELKYDNSYTKEEHPEEITFTETTYTGIPLGKSGDYAHVVNEGSIYFYNDDEEEWELFNPWNQERKIEEDNIISFDIPFDLPNMNMIWDNYLMPQLSGQGISVFNKKTENEDFAILVYHGKQLATDDGDDADKTGPLASITKYDGHGNVIHPDHSLLLEDIEKNFHQSFIRFIRTSREVKFKTKMKIVDFMKLRLQEKYTADGYVFIIKSMKMNVTVNDYSFVEMVIAVI